MPLSRYDKSVFEELHQGSHPSNVQFVSADGNSTSASLRQLCSLEVSTITDRYAALISQQKAGLHGNIRVHFDRRRQEHRELAAFSMP